MKAEILLLVAAVALTSLVAAFAVGDDAPPAAAGAEPADAAKQKLYHVVSFKFKPDAPKDKIREVEEAFAALPGKIPAITSFTTGTNVSPEKHDKGFTHGFILTFDTEKGRDEYLVHPDHKKFGALVGPVLADVFVIDFWGK